MVWRLTVDGEYSVKTGSLLTKGILIQILKKWNFHGYGILIFLLRLSCFFGKLAMMVCHLRIYLKNVRFLFRSNVCYVFMPQSLFLISAFSALSLFRCLLISMLLIPGLISPGLSIFRITLHLDIGLRHVTQLLTPLLSQNWLLCGGLSSLFETKLFSMRRVYPLVKLVL